VREAVVKDPVVIAPDVTIGKHDPVVLPRDMLHDPEAQIPQLLNSKHDVPSGIGSTEQFPYNGLQNPC